jgi:hypothetical protein
MRFVWTRLETVRYRVFALCGIAKRHASRVFGIEAEKNSGSAERMSSEASNELQRLLRMLTETAIKAEQEA